MPLSKLHRLANNQPSYNNNPEPNQVSPQNFPNTYQKPSYANNQDIDTMNVDDDDLPF